MALPSRSQPPTAPAPTPSLFSRVPLAFLLVLIGSLSYAGYTAASVSIAAFRDSWNSTDTVALHDNGSRLDRSSVTEALAANR